MSIKIPPVGALSASTLAAGAAKESAATSHFEGLLRSAIERPASPSSAEVAAAMRLRLLHQAIDLGEDEPGEFSAPPLSLIFDALPKLYGGRSIPSQSLDDPPAVTAVTNPPVQPSPPPPAAKSPAPLADIVERAAERYRIAPEVIRAVIRAESGFDARAVSPAGAQGLMQLMPGTARELGVTDPFDPEQNVMAGTRYLKQMLTRYGGDLEKALAAYNWGPGNLDRSDGRLPGETRRYIARIKGYVGAG